ncbi:MspA family protein OS=Tsukamurella paurometabola (strain ATCC 8368 / DSM / CCUG 35730 / CIP 100753 / JCM 10117 / KCTC 9821 / NBRC 16120 / NCIMB 702349/ NCTC 13040) OX=521096 GN=Tpau_3279 PE=4 SV=1 [Tsukamurella paurometabola]|uniref:MspA family protein n=1 Tax=Tsukamurella paurometabola (strain ATCC 8368 / DSM 20162 / CCUG 35730 / CIP 100753 / JCM 10117 / KCTC 9821 / NBRC 16120 / NCIMB 702349 / NCTC 13040) TaxID=521096 RepID=D5UVT2_TSUPD|nr:MspA family porin [Tsukamurella paurometabola]ADG79864.1 MspA family protein [Tsukamurella paurometabola DSM 20162]SUP37463.1 MspA [Tsukamurella paurometabola]
MASTRIRKASIGALAAAAVIGLVAPVATAGADTVIPLRNATSSNKIGSGGSITVTVKQQKARLSPGMVALPTTRNAWVSGVVSAKIDGADPSGGSIEAGYAVGCQIDVGSASINVGAEAGANNDSGNIIDSTGYVGAPSVKGTTGGSLSLAAGSIGTQSLTYDRATWPKPGDEVASDWYAPATDFAFDGATGSFTYTDQTIGVDGCAGYAQARLYVIVKGTVGNSKGRVVLWGDTFTLG